ncbi:MAG: ATP-binding protein [Bacteroidota bacterium]|nr:ATP-binding protein [Bacteroidota bacterium]
MNEIVIISGKGGTGKTSLAASLASLAGRDCILADCDVDAADMHLLMEPDYKISEDFYSGELAVIDQEKCTSCGICAEVCRFDAIKLQESCFTIDSLACEGCGYCSKVCPEAAIENIQRHVGQHYVSGIKTGATMVHASLKIGADNSGKLVAKVKNDARALASKNGVRAIIVDGSPGIGCPVVSSLSGADYVVLVTEPTVSGLHDLERVLELVKKFRLRSGCIINKYDLNHGISAKIKSFLLDQDVSLIAEFPYHKSFSKAITLGKTIIEYDPRGPGALIRKAWVRINEKLLNEEK